jgi:hypothetical protein
MSDLAVRASHQAWLRLKRASGGRVGYAEGGAPDDTVQALSDYASTLHPQPGATHEPWQNPIPRGGAIDTLTGLGGGERYQLFPERLVRGFAGAANEAQQAAQEYTNPGAYAQSSDVLPEDKLAAATTEAAFTLGAGAPGMAERGAIGAFGGRPGTIKVPLDQIEHGEAAMPGGTLTWPGAREKVEEYASRPTPLPPIEAIPPETPGGKWMIEDGSHRYEAAKLRGDKTIDVVAPTSAVPPEGLDKLTVNSILHPDTPAYAGSRGVEDVAADLHARSMNTLQEMGVPEGRITEPHPEHDEIISHAMASEAQAALNRPGANAADWYTGKVREAMGLAATMHPELAEDPLARTAYTAALSITSQGEKVPSNVRLAEGAYRYFKETGRFPERLSRDNSDIGIGAKAGGDMGENFAKLNSLIDERGMQGMHDFLHSQMSMRDLKALGGSAKEKMDTMVHGSAIFGPKVGGGFFQNLNGNYDPVTMDLWFMRNWGRLTGTLVGKVDPSAQSERLIEAMKKAGMRPPNSDEALLQSANDLIAKHEKDYKANRNNPDYQKSELTYAAERYQKAIQGINEKPTSGGQRDWMRARVNRAREILAQNGTNVTNADLQAILWYPEKELYGKLGARSKDLNVDYASVLRGVAKANGVSDDAIERAIYAAHNGPGPAAASHDARGDQGRGQGAPPNNPRAVQGGPRAAGAAEPVPPEAAGRGEPAGGTGLAQAQGEAARLAGTRKPLEGLPRGPFTLAGKPYVPGPNAAIHDAAEGYMASAGLKYDPPQTYQKVDKDRAARIAQAFDEMKHQPNNPAVRASYNAMIDETLAQYQSLKRLGIKFEAIKDGQPDPYRESPRLAAKDVAENSHLWFFPTRQGFGTVSKKELANNPMLRPTNEVVDGHRLLANDVFRIVHDVFGHLKDGNGFRADGEEHAWRSHSAMYSNLARPAMTSETRGQNSWLNYGPHGETNRTAKPADTTYADQKAGLLPRWVVDEGRGDPVKPKRATGGAVMSHDHAARRAHPAPTDGQKEAGNYRKGHTSIHGIPIAIENAKGSTRRGIGHGGKPWSVQMPAHYGYAKGTNGADGDEIDCYIGPHPTSRKVFVVNQHDADSGKFDEHKAMLCYASKAQALRDYEKAFSDGKGKDRVGHVVEMSVEDFKERLKKPGAFRKSIARAAGGRIGYADGGGPGMFDDIPAGQGGMFDDIPAAKPMSWSDVPGEALRNAPSSAVRLAKDVAQPFLHPLDTLGNIGELAAGAAQKMGLASGTEGIPKVDAVGQFFKDRYGGVENIKHTLAEDPVGALADASVALTGGETALGRLPGIAGKVGEASGTVGRAVNPLSLAGNAVKGAGSLIGKETLPERQMLANADVMMTPGQMKGGVGKSLEDAATSVPILGDFINAGRRNSVESFNQAVMNQALEPIGESLSRGNKSGHEAVAEVATKLGDAYDVLTPKLTYVPDAQFANDMRRVISRDVSILPGPVAEQYRAIINNRIGPIGAPMGGPLFKSVESEMTFLANQYRSAADPAQRGLGMALDNTVNAMRRNLERSNPADAAELAKINSGWAMYSRIRDAASRRATSGGVFMPSDLLNAIKRGDKSVGKGSFARGDALMQKFAEAGQKVLPSTLPDSGTPKRLAAMGATAAGSYLLHSPHVLAAGAAAALPYTGPGMALLNKVAAPRTVGRSVLPGLAGLAGVGRGVGLAAMAPLDRSLPYVPTNPWRQLQGPVPAGAQEDQQQ